MADPTPWPSNDQPTPTALMEQDDANDPLEIARRLVAANAIRTARGSAEDMTEHAQEWAAAETAWLRLHVLRDCPRCKYDLEGLPSEWKCPECGLNYSRGAYSFTPPRKRAWAHRYSTIFLGIATLAAMPVVLTGRGLSDLIRIAGAGAIVIGLITALINWIRDPTFKDYVIIDRKGIRIPRRGRGELVAAWQEIDTVSVSREGRVVFETKSPRTRIVVPGYVTPTALDAKLLQRVAKSFMGHKTNGESFIGK